MILGDMNMIGKPLLGVIKFGIHMIFGGYDGLGHQRSLGTQNLGVMMDSSWEI